ncbi:MAG TPA: alpha/beta hydrolase [Thermoleophilia bacterium]|nr:alpha/beta hydrolase [Thermoleophilia bacterium]
MEPTSSSRKRAAPAPPGDFITAGGARVHYVRSGDGPPVVYIHGAKGSVYDCLLSIGPTLAERYTVTAFDRPGSGFSRRPTGGGMTPQAQASVLRAAAVGLGIERPVLIGHSLGAAVALAWAVAAPESIAAVVTLGGYVLPLGGRPWVGALLRSPTIVAVTGGLGRSRLGRPLVDAALRRAFAPGPVPADYERIAPILALDRANLAGDGEDRRSAEAGLRALQPLYPSLAVPLVIVVGADDRMVPPSTSRRLHAIVPGSEFIELPGAGHLPQFTTPGAVLAAVDHAAELGGVEPHVCFSPPPGVAS